MIPKYDDMVKEADCVGCEKKGYVFSNLRVPCPFCVGLGIRLKPAGAPDKRVGPTE
jgi:hypothetical protein